MAGTLARHFAFGRVLRLSPWRSRGQTLSTEYHNASETTGPGAGGLAAAIDLQREAISGGDERTGSTGPLSHPDLFGVESLTSVRQLLEARVHLGHKTGIWDPRMKPHLFGTRSGVHIIDLDRTLVHLRRALNVAGHVARRNGIVLFVNERSQFERLVQQAARGCGEYFVTQRWVGGTLTNSHMLLGTLHLPDLIVFLSVPPSKTAIKEAAMCNIPSIGVLDSDCNPNLITYPVPGNDDTHTAMRLYCSLFSEVISRAKAHRQREEEGESNKQDRETTERSVMQQN